MTTYTLPDDLPIPEASDIIAPLEDDFSDLATAMQVALLRPGAVGSDTERDSTIPNPLPGQRVWRTDKMWEESYFAAGVVRVAGWYPTGGAVPRARLYKTADADSTSTATLTLSPVTFLLDATSVAFMQNGSTNLVAPVSGWYDVTGLVNWTTNANGYRAVGILTSGTGAQNGAYNNSTAPTGAGFYQNFTRKLFIEKGSNIQIAVSQNSGSLLKVQAGSTEVTVTYLGPA